MAGRRRKLTEAAAREFLAWVSIPLRGRWAKTGLRWKDFARKYGVHPDTLYQSAKRVQ